MHKNNYYNFFLVPGIDKTQAKIKPCWNGSNFFYTLDTAGTNTNQQTKKEKSKKLKFKNPKNRDPPTPKKGGAPSRLLLVGGSSWRKS